MFGCGWLSEVLRVFRNPCGLSAPPHTPWYRICSLYFIDFFPYRMCSLSCNFRMCSQYIWYLYYLALLDCLLEFGFAVLDLDTDSPKSVIIHIHDIWACICHIPGHVYVTVLDLDKKSPKSVIHTYTSPYIYIYAMAEVCSPIWHVHTYMYM